MNHWNEQQFAMHHKIERFKQQTWNDREKPKTILGHVLTSKKMAMSWTQHEEKNRAHTQY